MKYKPYRDVWFYAFLFLFSLSLVKLIEWSFAPYYGFTDEDSICGIYRGVRTGSAGYTSATKSHVINFESHVFKYWPLEHFNSILKENVDSDICLVYHEREYSLGRKKYLYSISIGGEEVTDRYLVLKEYVSKRNGVILLESFLLIIECFFYFIYVSNRVS